MSQEETNSSGLELVDYVTLTYDDIANVTTANADNNPSDNDLFLTKVIVQCVILAMAIFGNVILFITMRMRKRALTRVHWFILHLCLADLLVAFFNILPQLIWDVIGEWKAGDFMCRFIKFMQVFVMYLSTYVLVLTALDRRRAICSPLLSHTWTHRLIHLSVGGAYAISAVLSVPQAVIFKYQETSNGSGYMNCWVHFEPEWTLHFYVTSFYILVYIIPLLILIYAYGSIYYAIFIRHKQSKLHHNNSYEKASTHGTSKDSKTDPVLKRNGITIKGLRVGVLSTSSSKTSKLRNSSRPVLRTNSFAGLSRAKMRTVKLTLVIIVAYIGCWSPFFISQLWWLYDVNAPTNNKAIVIMLLLASLNSCCNPWIYMAFSGTISCCKKKPIRSYLGSPSPGGYTTRTTCRVNASCRQSKSVTTTPLTPSPSTVIPFHHNPLFGSNNLYSGNSSAEFLC